MAKTTQNNPLLIERLLELNVLVIRCLQTQRSGEECVFIKVIYTKYIL